MRQNAPMHYPKDLADTKPAKTLPENAEATLEADRNWEALSPHAQATDPAHVEVYLNDFIGIFQGGPTKRRQMTQHLFHAIDDIFQPNKKDDTAREEPISFKKLRKCDSAWSTQKVVLGWAIDTVKQVLTLPDDRKSNPLYLLNTTPPSASR